MKKQVRIFLAGALVVIPFAITVWAIVTVGMWVDNLVKAPLADRGIELFPGIGALILLASIYLIGLLTHFWAFRWALSLLEKLVTAVPGLKTIYESVRDMLKLFGGDANQMGRVVLYSPPDVDTAFLGILTNENPPGARSPDEVAVYFPLAYMIGGPIVYVSRRNLVDVDMSVEECMKICATAHVTSANAPRRMNASPAENPGT